MFDICKLTEFIITPEIVILILFIILEKYWHSKQEKEFDEFKEKLYFYMTNIYKISQDNQDFKNK
jgi:hypothetical protein